MSSNQLPKLAAAEMPIIAVIWDRGPVTVREVVEVVNATREEPVARNTILKQMQRLEEKGWLRRDGGGRPACYVATVGRESAERRMAATLRDSLFGGSPLALVRSLIGQEKLSEEEIVELRALVEEAAEQSNGKRVPLL